MYLFNLFFLQSSEAAGSDGSGTWLASPFVWWLCTGKRRDVLHLQLPWAAIALYQNLFSLGTFPRSKSRFAVPPDTDALWDVIASKHSLGGWGQEGHTGTQAGWEMWVLWASCWPLPNSLLSACWLHGPAIVQKWWCPPPTILLSWSGNEHLWALQALQTCVCTSDIGLQSWAKVQGAVWFGEPTHLPHSGNGSLQEEVCFHHGLHRCLPAHT